MDAGEKEYCSKLEERIEGLEEILGVAVEEHGRLKAEVERLRSGLSEMFHWAGYGSGIRSKIAELLKEEK